MTAEPIQPPPLVVPLAIPLRIRDGGGREPRNTVVALVYEAGIYGPRWAILASGERVSYPPGLEEWPPEPKDA